MGERWHIQKLAGIRATPWSLHQPRDQEAIFREPHEGHPPMLEEREIRPRQMKIFVKDLERFGHTPGCSQCEHVLKYRQNRPGLSHTPQCRERVMKAMAETDDMRYRVEGQEERLTRYLSERVEASDVRESSGRPGSSGDPSAGGLPQDISGLPPREHQTHPGSVRGVIGIPADEELSETQVLGVPRVFGFTLVPSGRMYPCLSSGAPVHG